ncbi:MAG: FecCD family ABC transporter permease [Gemmatimonadaceae bacterium]
MRVVFWVAAPVVLLVTSLLGIAMGAISLPFADVVYAVAGAGDPTTVAIVRSLRLPRVALAALVGAGLGMSGASLQGSLRNALAEPYLLGVSGGAAVGAVLAVAAAGNAGVPPGILPLASFAGAALAIGATILVARAGAPAAGSYSDSRVLLMAGVIIGAFANAVIMILLANAPPNAIRGALWWMMGSVSGADVPTVVWLAAYWAAGGAALLWYARDIDILALGEEPAAGLGVDAASVTRKVFLLSSLIAAATVAAAGLIGFVGLVVPHIVRSCGIRSHRSLIAGAALVGALLVVAADLAARTLQRPTELPLGAITAVIGVPFFLMQLRRLA